MAKKLQVKLVKSGIGFSKDQKATIEALGLKKLHSMVVHADNPSVRGMIFKIQHLLEVKEVD